jgi:hypothetical protein
MSANWLETGHPAVFGARAHQSTQEIRLARENVRLRDENERLRRRCDDLAASADIWIRLYEAALARAAQPDPATAGAAAAECTSPSSESVKTVHPNG